MIAWLEGVLLRKNADSVVVRAGSVGYRVFVSQRVLERLPAEGATVALEIHTQVREDAIHLFGFLAGDEREVFEALIDVTGIGPKAAVSILSGIDAVGLAVAICAEDTARLCSIPGVGKKKAERLILDLRERLLPLARRGQVTAGADQPERNQAEDLRSALANLGFKNAEVERALAAMRGRLAEEGGIDVLLPEALRLLRG